MYRARARGKIFPAFRLLHPSSDPIHPPTLWQLKHRGRRHAREREREAHARRRRRHSFGGGVSVKAVAASRRWRRGGERTAKRQYEQTRPAGRPASQPASQTGIPSAAQREAGWKGSWRGSVALPCLSLFACALLVAGWLAERSGAELGQCCLLVTPLNPPLLGARVGAAGPQSSSSSSAGSVGCPCNAGSRGGRQRSNNNPPPLSDTPYTRSYIWQ
jgi:hypothetical protein